MKRAHRWLVGVVATAILLLVAFPAPAAVEMSTGIRYVIPSGSLADCSDKAKTALSAYLQNPVEKTTGGGEWSATGPIGVTGPATAAAVVRCLAVAKGYAVTFTCVVQIPGNPYAADALCLDIAHNFSGKPTKPLPTPLPAPTGCTTASLVGTWTSDDKPGLTVQMDVNGGLTDSDGVSGNWGLYGSTATLTYYGTHAMTLSADGKHLRGSGYNFTRKC
ncbi:MAG: hypothetical protein JOY69_02295 [Candidatus Eremiobacteraeota bacterium]|nr:hypothetical protein [Candidatus Eremiobacteraeota bacterium]